MKDLTEDIKTGTFRHVYLLHGEENYLKFQMRDRLISAIGPEFPDMNISRFEGVKTNESDVVELGETLPFFSERRVIRLDRTGLFTRAAELLPDYMKSLPDYLYMVFTEDEVDKRTRLYKAVAASGRCVECGRQPDNVLGAWVTRMLGQNGLKIRRSTLTAFLERTGQDMNRISLEADKLIHFCSGRDEVTPDDIEDVVSREAEDRIFDMITALMQHKKSRAMELYADLMALRESPIKILSLISLQYNRLLMIRELRSGGFSDTQIAQKIGVRPYVVQKSAQLLKGCSGEYLKGALIKCGETDEAIKTGGIDMRMGIELLLGEL